METSDEDLSRKSKRHAKKCAEIGRILVKEEVKARVKQVSAILKKSENVRTEAENEILQQSPEIVQSIGKRRKSRDTAKQRLLEVEDDVEVMKSKCHQLAQAMKECKNVVVYTGAGISTAASIPDYRGPNGVWTLLQQGKEIKAQDLSDAEPTLTHMAIAKLHHENIVKHVVSQNCDGLHLRSGLSRTVLSEVHGNMFIELCKECKPPREYIRLFDVTERTGVRRHATGRDCYLCESALKDTIVHFGEKGGLQSPYNWQEAADAVDECDMILCLGSSLKILRKYPCLWCMDMRPKDRPKLYIVNLQWTPKDDFATSKINGKCDEVMKYLMEELNLEIPEYRRAADPIFKLSTPLVKTELDTTSKKILQVPAVLEPNLFSQGAKSSVARKKATKVKDKTEQKYKTIKSFLERGVSAAAPCNSHTERQDSESMDTRGSKESTSSESADTNVKLCAKQNHTDQRNSTSKVKLKHPLLTSKLGFCGSLADNSGIKQNIPETCVQCSCIDADIRTCTGCLNNKSAIAKDEVCSSVTYVTSHSTVTQMSVDEEMNTCKQPLTVDIKQEESKNSGLVQSCGNEPECKNVSKSPTSPITSIPGWFGKGCNPRKRKRKL